MMNERTCQSPCGCHDSLQMTEVRKYLNTHYPVSGDCSESYRVIKTIDQLRAEVERLTSGVDGWYCEVFVSDLMAEKAEAEAQNKELREALRPFANFACDCGTCLNCIALTAMKEVTS